MSRRHEGTHVLSRLSSESTIRLHSLARFIQRVRASAWTQVRIGRQSYIKLTCEFETLQIVVHKQSSEREDNRQWMEQLQKEAHDQDKYKLVTTCKNW